LTRASRTVEDPLVSMQSGGGSKDTWVLCAEEVARSAEAALAPAELRTSERSLSGIPSRAADNLFWLGRYTERLEQTLRTLHSVLSRLSGEGTQEGELTAIVSLMKDLKMLPKEAPSKFTARELEQQVMALIYKPDISGGVREMLKRIRL